jgi:hypothetical protein
VSGKWLVSQRVMNWNRSVEAVSTHGSSEIFLLPELKTSCQPYAVSCPKCKLLLSGSVTIPIDNPFIATENSSPLLTLSRPTHSQARSNNGLNLI